LSADGWPEGVGRHLLDTVDSTNAHAFRLAPHHAGPCWILGGEQTAGRGRRARAWASPRGNFHGTLLLLKWPNDVLLNGGKVAGILLESSGAGQGVQHLAIGIGVNLISAPDPALMEAGAVPPVTLLSETGLRVTPETFLDALAPAYARWEATFTTEGFAPLRAAWLAHAAPRRNDPRPYRHGNPRRHF